MKHLFKKAIKLAWKAYVFLCVLLITVYILLMVNFLVSRQFDIVELPNGTYMKRRHFFANTYEIVLRREDGKILVDEGIEFVCFNDTFVQGYTFSRSPGAFIYEKGQDEAILGRDPRYYEVWERSGLFVDTGGCGGDEKAMLGFGILIKDARYRSWRPFD